MLDFSRDLLPSFTLYLSFSKLSEKNIQNVSSICILCSKMSLCFTGSCVGSPVVSLKWDDMAVLGRGERVNVICEIQILCARSLPGVLIAFLQEKHSSAGVE